MISFNWWKYTIPRYLCCVVCLTALNFCETKQILKFCHSPMLSPPRSFSCPHFAGCIGLCCAVELYYLSFKTLVSEQFREREVWNNAGFRSLWKMEKDNRADALSRKLDCKPRSMWRNINDCPTQWESSCCCRWDSGCRFHSTLSKCVTDMGLYVCEPSWRCDWFNLGRLNQKMGF